MADLKPEEQARVLIDEKLAEAGWAVIIRSQFSNQENALAVEEALTKGNHEADYLLFLDGADLAEIYGYRALFEKLLQEGE